MNTPEAPKHEFSPEVLKLVDAYCHGGEKGMTEEQKIQWWKFIETDTWKYTLLNLQFWEEVASRWIVFEEFKEKWIDVSPISPVVLAALDKFRLRYLKQLSSQIDS